MSNSILIIEDDKIQADELGHRLGRLGYQVDQIATELEFRRELDHIKPYSLAVVDMMLRWTDPSPDMELPPPEIIQEGFYTAGLRCCRQLAAKGIRCLIFTALDPKRIPLRPGENFTIVNKSAGYPALEEQVRQLGPLQRG
jgi:CheY-like chemotaxis protein